MSNKKYGVCSGHPSGCDSNINTSTLSDKVKIYSICIGSTVGCNYEIDNFRRGFRYEVISMGVSNGNQNWIFRELSSEGLEFAVSKEHSELLIKNGNIKNL